MSPRMPPCVRLGGTSLRASCGYVESRVRRYCRERPVSPLRISSTVRARARGSGRVSVDEIETAITHVVLCSRHKRHASLRNKVPTVRRGLCEDRGSRGHVSFAVVGSHGFPVLARTGAENRHSPRLLPPTWSRTRIGRPTTPNSKRHVHTGHRSRRRLHLWLPCKPSSSRIERPQGNDTVSVEQCARA